MQRRQFLGFVLAFLAIVAACADALRAQSWPERSVRLDSALRPGRNRCHRSPVGRRSWAKRLASRS